MNHGWEKKRLGDVCQINFGKRIVAKDTQSGPYYVYGGGGATFTTKDYNRENCMIVSRFAMSPECVRFVRGRFFLNDSGLSVDSITDSLTQEFVDKYLWANQPRIYNLGRGAAQKNLNTKSFSELTIPLPPVNIQLKIVSEIDKLNELIEIKRKQLKDLDTLSQSLFYETFGDPITNPQNFQLQGLVDVCDAISTGITYKPEMVSNNGTVVLRSSNVQESKFVLDDVVRIQMPLKESQYVQKNDILMCSRNGSARLVGKVCLIPELVEKMSWGAFMTIIRSKYYHYLFHYFRLHAFREQLNKTKTSTVNQITIGMLKDIKLPVPPISLQNEFAEKVEVIEEQKRLIESTIADLETLLASRMGYWFND